MATEDPKIEVILLSDIDDNPEYNSRSELGDITDLKNSISQKGVMTPVIVKPHTKKSGYRLIAGFRRVAACKELGLERISAKIENAKMNANQMLLVNVAENIQREELNPMDEAIAYAKLVKGGMSISDICTEVGKSRPYVERRMGLLQLSEVVQTALKQGRITVGAAQDISRLPEDLHAKYVVMAEELANSKLRERIEKELSRIESRGQAELPTPDAEERKAKNARLEKFREELLDEISDMAMRYAEDQVPHLHVLDISGLDEPSTKILLEVLHGCRMKLHGNEELLRPETTTPLDDDASVDEGKDEDDESNKKKPRRRAATKDSEGNGGETAEA